MTIREFNRRRALISRRARLVAPPAEVPDSGPGIDDAVTVDVPNDVYERRAQAGANWVARHRGLINE